MRKLKISIQGMHCASCASNIERSMKKVAGIKNVSVSAVTNKAFVECDENVGEEELKKAVARAGGYKVVKVE